ncbi:MAG TPA: hypothetical protein VJJ47_04060 [Candidatus Paceibacterota bacterium]
MDTPDPNPLDALEVNPAQEAARPEPVEGPVAAPEPQVPAEGGEEADSRPLTVVGQVVEALPNTLFRVLPEGGTEQVLAYLGGKMRLHRIRVLIGDRVEIIPDPYGGRARIVRRL